jgi:DNA-binding NarL/FixJ family response regulator
MPSTILHLDDHDLFSNSVEKLIQTSFPQVNYIHFKLPEDCLGYISDAYKTETTIRLIITDFNHPGLNGYHFAKHMRDFEKDISIRTPILLLTMAGENDQKVRKGFRENVFDFYLPKNASGQEISNIIQSSLDHNERDHNTFPLL